MQPDSKCGRFKPQPLSPAETSLLIFIANASEAFKESLFSSKCSYRRVIHGDCTRLVHRNIANGTVCLRRCADPPSRRNDSAEQSCRLRSSLSVMINRFQSEPRHKPFETALKTFESAKAISTHLWHESAALIHLADALRKAAGTYRSSRNQTERMHYENQQQQKVPSNPLRTFSSIMHHNVFPECRFH